MKLISKTLVEENVYELVIRVEGEEYAEAYEKSYEKNSKNLSIKGFRKGKTPRRLVMKMVGENYFCEDAVEFSYSKAYNDALREAELVPVALGDIQELKEVSPKGYTFRVHVTVRPEVKLGNFKGLKIEKYVVEISPEDVENELNLLADRMARLVEVENRPAQNGDTANLDYAGYLDGELFEGGSAEGYDLVLGSGQFIPGFEDQIVGHSVGENFDIKVTFPEEYPADELKGKEVVFKSKLNGLKCKELPVIDDEFVKDISEHNTLDELKAEIKEKLTEREKQVSENEIENRLCEMAAEVSEVNIPRVMIEDKITLLVQDFNMRLKYQGIDFNEYMEFTRKSMENIRTEFEDEAYRQVKTMLTLQQIVINEKLEPTDEDIEADYKRIANEHNVDIEKVRQEVTVSNIRESLRIIMAINLIKNNAEITEIVTSLADKYKKIAEKSKVEEPKKQTRKRTSKKSAEDTEKTSE